MGASSGTRDFEALFDGRPPGGAVRTAGRPWDDLVPERAGTAPAPSGRTADPKRRHAVRRNLVLLGLGVLLVLPWLLAQPDPDIALVLALAFVAALLAGLALVGVAAGGLASAVVDRRALFSRLVPIAAGACMVVYAARSGADPGDLAFTVLDGTGPRIPDVLQLAALGLAFDVVAGATFALRSAAGLLAAIGRRVRD